MAEHKHAAVLRAIADGKAVQWRLNSTWNDYVDGHPGCPLYCMDGTEWRIKPERKPDVVRYVNLYDKEACVNRFHAIGADDLLGTIKCTIDGETGKLKSAEVLP